MSLPDTFSVPMRNGIGNEAAVITQIAADQRERMQAFQSFKFNHSLADLGPFTLADVSNLIDEMIARGRLDNIYARIGTQDVAPADVRRALDALGGSSSDTWIRLTQTDEIIPKFKAVTDRFIRDLSELYSRDIKAETVKTFATLFVSSPNEITPYHFDHTWNFLLQLSGTKTVYLFDPHDPSILDPRDIENFYAGVWNFKQKPDSDGIGYDLKPGEGVHHPVNAPHRVQNGPEVSISLSLGLCLHSSTRDARVHQANYLLRKWGLSPRPIGASVRSDMIKEKFVGLFRDRNAQSFNSIVHSGYRRLTLPARGLAKLRRLAVRT